MQSERRDEAAATAFFAKVIASNGSAGQGRHGQRHIERGRSVQHELPACDA